MSLSHLAHAMRKNRSSGRPLRTVWRSLTNATAQFRLGTLALVGAGSGTGKSAFALTLAIRSGARTIYFSADSGPGVQLSRSISMLTGIDMQEVQRSIEKGHYFEDELKQIIRIRWDFDAGPSLDDIEEAVDAYAHLHGEYPELVIVDNLLNVVSDEDSESYKAQENILLFLDEMARKSGALVLVLAHLVGEYDDGDKPAPMSALRGKVSKIPAMILTLFREGDPLTGERLGVAIVKNRAGQANAAANMIVPLEMDLSKMLIEDPKVPTMALPA